MQIISIRPEYGREGKTIARFDLEMNPNCRLYGLRLVQNGSRRLTYAPNAGGKRVATFTGEFADSITALASAAFDGGSDAKHANRN